MYYHNVVAYAIGNDILKDIRNVWHHNVPDWHKVLLTVR